MSFILMTLGPDVLRPEGEDKKDNKPRKLIFFSFAILYVNFLFIIM